MKAAMKARDKERLGTIRLIQSEFKRIEVDERIEVDDARALAVLDKMVKQRRDSAEQFQEAGRDELAAQENAEIALSRNSFPHSSARKNWTPWSMQPLPQRRHRHAGHGSRDGPAQAAAAGPRRYGRRQQAGQGTPDRLSQALPAAANPTH